MKFISLAIASLAAAVASAKTTGGIRKLNKKAVPKMKTAMKYSDFKKQNPNAPARKLNDEFEITGYYSIVPQDCLTFTVDSEDMYDDDILAYSANEQAFGIKSYMIFQVVETENRYYEDGSEDGLWIAELNEFMEAAAQYKFAIKEAYCEQCNEFEDYCLYGGNANQADEEEGDEGRKLYGNFINCNQCSTYNCWEDENGNDQDDPDEVAAELLNNIAECAETGLYAELVSSDGRKLNDEALELSAGYICGNSANGGRRGPEIALFLDQDCQIHYKHPNQDGTAMDYYNSYSGAYYDNADEAITSDRLELMEEMITAPFTDYGIDCAPFPEFDDPDEQNEDNNDNDYEANEVCENIMGAEAVPLYNCGNEDGDQEDEEEEEQREGNYYNFEYEAQLSENTAEDVGLVCEWYKEFDVENDYVEIYEGETHYKPEKASAEGGGLSSGGIAAIVIVALAVVGGAAYFLTQKKKDDSKLEPLTNRGGTSA